MSKMQRFGLIALLIAGAGVILVILFLPAGPLPGGQLIGTWSMEVPGRGDGGVRLTFDRNGTYRLTVPNRPAEVTLTESGTWQAHKAEGNRLIVGRKTYKVSIHDLQGKLLQEKPREGTPTEEWNIDASTDDPLRVLVPTEAGKAQQFLLRRVPN